MDDNIDLKESLKRYLALHKISVAELERRIGQRHAIINIIHGRSKNPGINLTYAIAKALGVSIEAIIEKPKLPNLSKVKKLSLQQVSDQDTLWDSALGQKVCDAVNSWMATNAVQASIKQVSCTLQDLYCYHKDLPELDPKFVDWLCKKNLLNVTIDD